MSSKIKVFAFDKSFEVEHLHEGYFSGKFSVIRRQKTHPFEGLEEDVYVNIYEFDGIDLNEDMVTPSDELFEEVEKYLNGLMW